MQFPILRKWLSSDCRCMIRRTSRSWNARSECFSKKASRHFIAPTRRSLWWICLTKPYTSQRTNSFKRWWVELNTVWSIFIYPLILQLNKERAYSPKAHVIAGGAAGAIAAAFTTPLDVCKTLLNTQEGGIGSTRGLTDAVKKVYQVAGFKGFFKGLQARVLYQMPATAVCWSTYEFFKYLLNRTEKKKPMAPVTLIAPSKEISLSFDDNKSTKQPLHFVLQKDSPKILNEIPSTSIHPTTNSPPLPYPRELPAMSNGIVYAHTMHENHRPTQHLTDFRSNS